MLFYIQAKGLVWIGCIAITIHPYHHQIKLTLTEKLKFENAAKVYYNIKKDQSYLNAVQNYVNYR